MRALLNCARCGHAWLPRDNGRPPKQCPKCRSNFWNRPRTRDTKTPPARWRGDGPPPEGLYPGDRETP